MNKPYRYSAQYMTALRPMKITIRKKKLFTTWNAKSLARLQGFASSILGKCDVNHFCHLPRCADSWLNKW